MADNFDIFVFTWNAGGLRLCETASEYQANKDRSKFFNFKKDCAAPDFYEGIRAKVLGSNPAVVVISTQNEAEKGTYFHSSFLPQQMGEINYGLLKREKVVGEGSSLRMSIYIRYDQFDIVQQETMPDNKFHGDNGQVNISCKIGNRYSKAIGAYLRHPTYGKFAFVSTYLPGNIELLNLGSTIKDLDEASKEAAMLSANQLCLISILHKLTTDLTEAFTPDHVVLLGDLNYDIIVEGWENKDIIEWLNEHNTAKSLKWLQQHDQLNQVMNFRNDLGIPLRGYSEGVENQGPLFAPTFNLKRDRSDSCNNPISGSSDYQLNRDCYTSSKADENSGHSLAWADRILYKEILTSPYMLSCQAYNSMDMGNTHKSNHAPVYSLFSLKPANDDVVKDRQ